MVGNKMTKRSKAPAFWKIHRKRFGFVTTTAPGPHPKEESYPVALLIRDILGLVKTYREAKTVIHEGKIIVDGIPRKKPDFSVGLMDVVEIPSIGKIFRLVPILGNPLYPIAIDGSEKSLKLCKVMVKKTVDGGRTQYGFHDGRSIVGDGMELNLDDTCLMETPSQKVIKSVKLQKGTTVIVTKGAKVGRIGKVEQIKLGTFSRPKMVSMSIEGLSTELPSNIVFAVGEEKPMINISRGV
ncbi:MAG: 30S ribosomal protein S4e [Nitrososphaerales archaeon]